MEKVVETKNTSTQTKKTCHLPLGEDKNASAPTISFWYFFQPPHLSPPLPPHPPFLQPSSTRDLAVTNSSIIFEWMQHRTIDNTLTFIHSLLIHLIFSTLIIMTQPPEQNSRGAAGGVLKNFANFTGKHLCWSLFFTKLQAFRQAMLLKGDSYTGVFLLNLRSS